MADAREVEQAPAPEVRVPSPGQLPLEAGGLSLPDSLALAVRPGVPPTARADALARMQRGAGNRSVARMVSPRLLAREPTATAPPPAAAAAKPDPGMEVAGKLIKVLYDRLWKRLSPPEKRPDTSTKTVLPHAIAFSIQSLAKAADESWGIADVSKDTDAFSKLIGAAGNTADFLDYAAKEFLATDAVGTQVLRDVLHQFPEANELLVRKALSVILASASVSWINDAAYAHEIGNVIAQAYDKVPELRSKLQTVIALATQAHSIPDLVALGTGIVGKDPKTLARGSASLPGGGSVEGSVVTENGGLRMRGAARTAGLTVTAEGDAKPGTPAGAKITIAGKDASHLVEIKGDDIFITAEGVKTVGDSTASIKIGKPGTDGTPVELKVSAQPTDYLKARLLILLKDQGLQGVDKLEKVQGNLAYAKGPFDASLDVNLALTPNEKSKLAAHLGFKSADGVAEASADWLRTWSGSEVPTDQLRTHMRYALKKLALEADMSLTMQNSSLTGLATGSFSYRDGDWMVRAVGGVSTGPGGSDPYAGAELGAPLPFLPGNSLVFGVRTAPSVPIGGPGQGPSQSIPAAGAVFTLTLTPGAK